jgi:hypothetical protein
MLSTLFLAGPWIGSSMVEQLTLNQLVEGSSPSRSTKFLSGSGGVWLLYKKVRFAVALHFFGGNRLMIISGKKDVLNAIGCLITGS